MPKGDTTHLRKWIVGKPLLLALRAIQIASFADQAYEGIRRTIAEDRLPKVDLMVRDTAWLRLYREHRTIQDFLGAMVGLEREGEDSASAWMDSMRELQRMPASEIARELEPIADELLELMREQAEALHAEVLETIEAIGSGDDGEETDDDAMRNFFSQREAQFILIVWLPCMALYREHPGKLLRAARQGDLDALSKLLRLDKSVIQDPRIARELIEASQIPGRSRFNALAKAFAGKPGGRITLQRTRRALAGLISALAASLNHPLTAPEIQRLFDAIARARGQVADRHIATGETLSKAIQRERPTWPI